MSSSDSLFLIEIKIEDFVSFIKCKEFGILCTFSDLFSLDIKDPRVTSKRPKEQTGLKQSSLTYSTNNDKLKKPKLQATNSIVISYDVNSLIKKMEKMPMVIFLRKKSKSVKEFGFMQYEWEKLYIDYLRRLEFSRELPQPIQTVKKCTVLNEAGKQKIASFKTTVKLSIITNGISIISNIISNKSQSTIPHKVESQDIITEVEIARVKKSDSDKSLVTTFKTNEILSIVSADSLIDVKNIHYKKTEVNEFKMKKKRTWISTTDLNEMKHVSPKKSKSTSAIQPLKKLNILNYIYDDLNGPYRKQVFYVGYFTVDPIKSDHSRSTKESSSNRTSSQSDKSNAAYKTSGMDKSIASSSSESVCVFSKPTELDITKCKKIHCENRVHRDVHTPPDPQVLLNLENMNKTCCDKTEKVEEVVGGVTATMKFGKDPCFCTCECTFGYMKKTTFCDICGGYEKLGEDLAHKTKHDLPTPCPVFHKIIDKNKLKVLSTSGSDTKKKDDSGQKSVRTGSKSGTSSDKRSVAEKKSESEKDRKKPKKEKKDDRFKFNYGYKAPQIGHMHCAMPCSGTLGPVPKNMGWLWNADNVPGLKVLKGWRPGAISKQLLRKLNKAKRSKLVVEEVKQTRKIKKRIEEKAILTISKVDGEYKVEMQAMPDGNEENNEQYSPLIYKIAKENKEDRRNKKERLKRRALRRAVKDVKVDYDRTACDNICLPAYKRAVGILKPDGRSIPAPTKNMDKGDILDSCSCSDLDVTSSCTSSEVDWEIHFSPPVIRRR